MGRVNGPVDRSRNSDVYINERPRGIKNCPCCTPPSGTSSRKLSSTYSPRRSHCEIRTCVLSISSTRDWNTGSARFGCSPASGMSNCSSNSQTSLSASSLTNTTLDTSATEPSTDVEISTRCRQQATTQHTGVQFGSVGDRPRFHPLDICHAVWIACSEPPRLVQFIQLDQRKRLASDFASASHAEG
jgi:hypothetical protein